MIQQSENPISKYLDSAATNFTVPDGDLAKVMDRGRKRARRTRRGRALLVVVALIASAAGTQRLLGTDHSDDTRIASITGGAMRGDVGLNWSTSTPNVGLNGVGLRSPLTEGNGGLYALSTAPGYVDDHSDSRRNKLWKSTNYLDWTQVSTIDPAFGVEDLASWGDRIYAVGSATGSSKSVDLADRSLVGWSEDGGASIERTDLPYDAGSLRGIIASRIVRYQVAAGSMGTLIVLAPSATLDVPSMLPSGITAPNGWVTTSSGVDLLGNKNSGCLRYSAISNPDKPQPNEVTDYVCNTSDPDNRARPYHSLQEAFGVTHTFSFEELGVDPETRGAALGQPVAFFAKPGSNDFERVELPSMKAGWQFEVEADDSGFEIANGFGPAGTNDSQVFSKDVEIMHSADGRTFSSPQALPGINYFTSIGNIGGLTVAIGNGPSGGVVVRSDGSGGWTKTQLTDILDPDFVQGRKVGALISGIGEFGAAIYSIIQNESPDSAHPTMGRILITRDGTTWSDYQLSDLAGRQDVSSAMSIFVTQDRAVVVAGAGECAPPDCTSRKEQIALIATAN